LPSIGALTVSPSIPGVYFAIVVQKKDHQCQIIIEFEKVEVDIVESSQPDANELVGKVFYAFETDHLPVEFPASDSRIAPQDYHKWLGAFSGLGPAFLKV
jgi:hypothetical protein